jgi:hypothetical protein
VAAELAAADDCDDIQVVNPPCHIDRRLTPPTSTSCKAANGAIWLADLSLADRLASGRARRRRAGSQFLRAHALSWLGEAKKQKRCSPTFPSLN